MNKRILVVEDDKVIRDTMIEILSLEGYQVEEAANGQEGIDKLSLMPDLIVLDLMMPVKDGFQFRAEQLENPEWAKIPVIVMSADGHIQDKFKRINGFSYIRKPPDIELVLKTILSALNQPSA